MKCFITSLAFLILGFAAQSQIYQTKNGFITISGRYKGNALVAASRQLHMLIDYDKAAINLHVAIPLLVTENDSLNRILAQFGGSELSFHGYFNTSYVHTKSHPKVKQQVAGTITLNKITRPFKMEVTLEHSPSGNINCVITGNFVLDLLSFNIPVAAGENNVRISFRELLLKKIKEQ